MTQLQNDHMKFQRKVLGVLCGLLAPACLLFGLFGINTNLPSWYMSISATYYANSKICMIGLLFATSVFFFTYKGYDKWDRIIAYVQAVSALGVIVFPCKTSGVPEHVGLFSLPVGLSNTLHCISASALFIAFAFNILFLFTKSVGEPTEGKKFRNKIYRICGGIIVFGMILMVLGEFLRPLVPSWFPYTWFCEFIMLEAFAVAWIVKSEWVYKTTDTYFKEKLNGSINKTKA